MLATAPVPDVPAAAPSRRINMLARLAKDISICVQDSPLIRLEALKSTGKTFARACASDLSAEEDRQAFRKSARDFAQLVCEYRTTQETATAAADTTSYRPYSGVELTDCAYQEFVQEMCTALSKAKESDALPLLQSCLHAEKQLLLARQNELAARHNSQQAGAPSLPNLSQEIRDLILPLLPSAQEVAEKQMVAKEILSVLGGQARGRALTWDMFGSSASGLGFANADLDIALYSTDFAPQELDLVSEQSLVNDTAFANSSSSSEEDTKDARKFLNKLDKPGLVVLRVADLLRESGLFSNLETVSSARVPVVKMVHVGTQTQCDVAVGDHNRLAVLNTKLLRYYGELDERVKLFILMVKYWAKKRRVGDASEGFISSYGWTLLSLYFLQKRAYIPNLQQVRLGERAEVDCNVNGFHVCFSSGKGGKLRTNFDLDELLRGFFRYYATEFKQRKDVVSFYSSPRQHHLQARRGPGVPPWRMSIIDPFELSHDLGTTLSGRRAQVVINHELLNAHEMLSSGRASVHDLLFGAPILSNIGGRICTACGESGHRTRDCIKFDPAREKGAGGPGAGAARNTEKCHRCGQPGHIARKCMAPIPTARLGLAPPARALPKLDFTSKAPPAATAKGGGVLRLGATAAAAVETKPKISLLDAPLRAERRPRGPPPPPVDAGAPKQQHGRRNLSSSAAPFVADAQQQQKKKKPQPHRHFAKSTDAAAVADVQQQQQKKPQPHHPAKTVTVDARVRRRQAQSVAAPAPVPQME